MGTAARLPGLDLLRAVAIVWVMLFHAFVVGGLGPDWDWLSRFGWAGVDIFFVLSGFLIGGPLLASLQRGEPLRLGRFYARRTWRILPAFAVVLAIYTLLPGLREVPGMAPWWRFASFTLNLSIDYQQHQAFSHAWSLCVEEHFYLLFPLLAWWLSRQPASTTRTLVMALVLGGIAWRSAVWLHDSALDPARNWYVEDIYYPTWCRLDGLLVGVLLAACKVYRPRQWERWLDHGNRLLAVGLLFVAAALWLFRDRVGLLANSIGWPVLSLALGMLLCAAASGSSLLGRRAVPLAGWLATVSYSLYLSHKLAMHVAQQLMQRWLPLHGLAAFAFYVLIIALFGAALHYGVERPCLRWRDRVNATPTPLAAASPG